MLGRWLFPKNLVACATVRIFPPKRYMYTSRKRPLRHSLEAQHQLTLGSKLDPEHPIAPSVPILEQLFDDRNLYASNYDALASDNRHFVSPETALATAPCDIKGANALAVQQLFAQRVLNQCRTQHRVQGMLSLYYFPPWHPISQARKSRPGLVVLRGAGLAFNGAKFHDSKQRSDNKARSANPLDYAVWRQCAARRVRLALWRAWEGATIPPRDGLYVAQMHRVVDQEDLDRAMTQFFQIISKSNLSWADSARVNLEPVNRQLARVHLPPLPSFLEKNQWTLDQH